MAPEGLLGPLATWPKCNGRPNTSIRRLTVIESNDGSNPSRSGVRAIGIFPFSIKASTKDYGQIGLRTSTAKCDNGNWGKTRICPHEIFSLVALGL